MELACQICHKTFEWVRPPKQGGVNPKICGTQDENGKFIPDPECKRKRNVLLCQKSYDKNYRSKPGQKPAKKWPTKPSYRATPVLEVKRRCICIKLNKNGKKRRCNKITANNGQNRYFCQDCWNDLTEYCSEQYIEMIYDAGCDVAGVQTIKDGKRSRAI